MAKRRRAALTRDVVLFTIGVLGIVWSTLFEEIDRPYLLAVFAAMVGLPTYLSATLHKTEEGEEKE